MLESIKPDDEQEGSPYFNFLFPAETACLDYDVCDQCNHQVLRRYIFQGHRQMLRVPLPDERMFEENLQRLVDAATAPTKAVIDCPCGPPCKCTSTNVGVTTQSLLTVADALIVQLQRLDYVVPILKPGEKASQLKYRDNRRRVPFLPTLQVPSLDGLQHKMMTFELASTVEHSGSIERGHFVCHIKTPTDYYTVDDLTTKIVKSPIPKVELSDLFLFKRIK